MINAPLVPASDDATGAPDAAAEATVTRAPAAVVPRTVIGVSFVNAGAAGP